jgi:hypothetical protein
MGTKANVTIRRTCPVRRLPLRDLITNYLLNGKKLGGVNSYTDNYFR